RQHDRLARLPETIPRRDRKRCDLKTVFGGFYAWAFPNHGVAICRKHVSWSCSVLIGTSPACMSCELTATVIYSVVEAICDLGVGCRDFHGRCQGTRRQRLQLFGYRFLPRRSSLGGLFALQSACPLYPRKRTSGGASKSAFGCRFISPRRDSARHAWIVDQCEVCRGSSIK